MKYCKNCASELVDNAVICPKCGVPQNDTSAAQDTGGPGWGILGFCIPIAGLILYLVWKDSKPKSGKAAGKGALISVIIAVIFYVLSAILAAFAAML